MSGGVIQVHLSIKYEHLFDQIRVKFRLLFCTLLPLIESVVAPKLKQFKIFLQDCFQELEPQLVNTESFDDIMDIVREKCTIINICCLEAVVNWYNITEAQDHIEEYKADINTFCQKMKAKLCAELEIGLPYPDTIEFILEWNEDEHALCDIQCLLSKAFCDMANVVVKVIDEGKLITND